MADEYEVKVLLARRRDNQGNYEYLVRWSGRYSDSKFDSWEPFANLEGELLLLFALTERISRAVLSTAFTSQPGGHS